MEATEVAEGTLPAVPKLLRSWAQCVFSFSSGPPVAHCLGLFRRWTKRSMIASGLPVPLTPLNDNFTCLTLENLRQSPEIKAQDLHIVIRKAPELGAEKFPLFSLHVHFCDLAQSDLSLALVLGSTWTLKSLTLPSHLSQTFTFAGDF